jgi:hypothetical protein
MQTFLKKDLASLGSNAYVVPMQNEYEINFNKFQNGEISETEWREFCDKVMNKVLADTKDVFERLKVR